MHNSVIQIEDGAAITLSADKDGTPNGIGVLASVPTPSLPDGRVINIISAIFFVEAAQEKYCSPGLLDTPKPWDFDLEIDDLQRLARLG
jgi:hypothetical protein